MRALAAKGVADWNAVPTVDASWERIERWLADNAPHVAASLRPGATAETLAELDRFGLALPAGFVAAWSRHDGQEEQSFFRHGYALLPVSQIAHWWDSWRNPTEEHRAIFVAADARVEAGPGVAQRWYHPDWMPIAKTDYGSYICVDLAPEPGGVVGQIVYVYYEEPERYASERSIEALFDTHAGMLEADLVDYGA
jgi:cell wall assembly regulator SMI1